jgi:DNA-binding SARP family transcriptional activator
VRKPPGRRWALGFCGLVGGLAALALAANRPVPVDPLLGYAWGEESPRDVRNALQTLVARLRRAARGGRP